MKKLFIDPFSGISGDMFLGALVDAGLPLDILNSAFEALHLPEHFQISAEKVQKGSLAATLFKIDLEEDQISHEEHADHTDHVGHTDHDHDHDHSGYQHTHHHRTLADIRHLLNHADLSEAVKEKALLIFEKLALAEAQVHGVKAEDVHFHEVGATDSILDIVGAAVGLDYFGIEHISCGVLPWTSGHIHTQHGEIPLPAPATLTLLTSIHAPLRPVDSSLELVTPTGAAILAAFAEFEQPGMSLITSGTGAGKKDLPWANVLRVMIGEDDQPGQMRHSVLETHIDDMNPEFFGHLMDKLFAAGALDVAFEPIYMKKNRPATRLTVIAKMHDEANLAALILAESSSFGVRTYAVKRYEAQRDVIEVQTRLGIVRVKRKWLDGKIVYIAPEYEDCRKLAVEHDLPLHEVFHLVMEKLSMSAH